MKVVDENTKIVWAIRTANGGYRGKSDHTVVKSMKSAHTWPSKGWAENRMRRGETLVPFALVEVDPDSITTKPRLVHVEASEELKRILETKL